MKKTCEIKDCEKDISSPKDYYYITSQNMAVCERHAEIYTVLSRDFQNKVNLWKSGKMN